MNRNIWVQKWVQMKDFLLFRSVNAKKTAGHFGLAAVCFRMRFDL